MSNFYLIEIEKEEAESFPDYESLDFNRETEFRIYMQRQDQYGNKSSVLLARSPNINWAKRFLRSCKLTEGILVND